MTTPHDGMTLVFSDTFSYSGSPPIDPSNWFIGDPRPGHTGFSDAKFLLAGDTNINTVFQGGGGSPLIINAAYSTAYNATYGTDWISGLISSAWDSSGILAGVAVRQGYFEVVMTVPYDPNAQGRSGGTGSGSGTWPAFWLMQGPTILGTGPTMEIDTELLGVGYNQFPATSQWWPLSTISPPPMWNAPQHSYFQYQEGGPSALYSLPDFQGTSHTFGMLIDQFNVTWFFDGVAQIVMPLSIPESTDPFFLMINLGMGGGWPIIPPTSPATAYPLIVTSAKIWETTFLTTVTGVSTVSVTPGSGGTLTVNYTASSLPPPTFTGASSPSTSGSAVTIGTVAPGTSGDTLTVTLTSDPTFSSGSSLAISSGNLVYTPGTITSGNAGTDTLSFTLNESNGASASFTKAVTLTFSGSGPTIAHSVSANASSGTSIALPALNVPANSVICVFATITFDTITSVTDSSSLTWTLEKSENPSFYPVALYWTHTTSAISSDTITVNFGSGGGNVISAVAFAVTGCTSLTAPFDTNSSIPAGSASDPVSISTTAPNSLVIAAFRGSTAISSAGSGFTLIEPSAGYLMTEYKALTSAASGLSVTDGIASDAICAVVAALV